MLQSVLKQRFSLKAHREMKEMPVYALVVGRNGPKLRQSSADAVPVSNHSVHGRNQTMALVNTTMHALAEGLGDYVSDRPVIDETGLSGTYDIQFEATPDFRMNHDPEPGDISVFTAVQEQLGLKLQSQKEPVNILVIDHVEAPSAN